MPITWDIDERQRRVFITVTSPYTRDQGRTAVAAITAHPGFGNSFGFVVEAVGAQPPDFVGDVLYFVSTHRHIFEDTRIAIVVTLGSGRQGKSRLASVLEKQRDLPATIRIAQTYREAERWLAGSD
jgi:hypothetical protein